MKIFILTLSLFVIGGCAVHQPIKTMNYVDIDRFMGRWHVIASIPTFMEKDAHNAIEIYKQNPDGSISTVFSFNKGGFDGKRVSYNPTGEIVDKQSNAVWKMTFLWPFKADYRIVHVDENYTVAIIGRDKRDYVWIMARDANISGKMFSELMSIIKEQGYDPKQIKKVPQKTQTKELAWRT